VGLKILQVDFALRADLLTGDHAVAHGSLAVMLGLSERVLVDPGFRT
jgi:hypothetical protein